MSFKNEYSALTLAYLGDAVFELMIREYIVKKGNKQTSKLHNEAKKFVNAVSQSKMVEYIFEKLDDNEKSIVMRGRNSNTNHSAKSSSLIQYKYATGLEALFGYLYLNEEKSRLNEILLLCKSCVEN